MVGNGDLTGSDRSHISVSYHDGLLDTSESMYFHKTFPLHEGWHSRYGHSTTIVAWISGLGVFGTASTIMPTIPYFYCVRKSCLQTRKLRSWRLFITYGGLAKTTKILGVQHTR